VHISKFIELYDNADFFICNNMFLIICLHSFNQSTNSLTITPYFPVHVPRIFAASHSSLSGSAGI
jgi:hypothetical protein